MNKSFILTCDSSHLGLGYILGQIDENGRERVIEYGGRALHGSEKNYSASELECLAIVSGVKTFNLIFQLVFLSQFIQITKL